MKKTIALIFAFIMLLSIMVGCKVNDSNDNATTSTSKQTSNVSSSGEYPANTGSYIDPITKYDEPVDVHMVLSINPPMVFPKGDSWTNNVWTRAFKDELNINLIFDWTCPWEQYETKLNLAIASKDLPDIFKLSNYSQFKKLVDANMLYDLTDVVVTSNLSEQLAGYLKQRPHSKEWATLHGRQYGLALGGINLQSPYSLLWRDDWFKQWGGPMPKTMEEYIEMAKDFADMDRKNRFALGLTKSIYEGQAGFVGMANANGAYPGVWYEDETGKLVYGDIQPQMKKVLQTYAKLYAEGYIDPAFASYDGMKIAEQLTSGKIGATIAQFWVPGWPLGDLYAAEKVTWSCADIVPFSDYKGELKLQTDEPKPEIYVVNKNFDHPEALLRMMSFASAKVNGPPDIAEPEKYHSDEKYDYQGSCPIYPVLADVKVNLNTAIHVTEALDKNDESYLVTPHDWTQYKRTKSCYDSIKAGKGMNEDWASYISWYGPNSFFGRFNKYYDNNMLMVTKLVGYQTDEMVRSWENLKQYVQQAYTEFIMGIRPLDEFDAFVEEWRNMGGAIVEIEVNEWYKSR
ncbi:MAG: extracellular solute-binding protein [Firmicutes bacterium]|nr:extracellular solute-binding protein [Bacillota bacterium]